MLRFGPEYVLGHPVTGETPPVECPGCGKIAPITIVNSSVEQAAEPGSIVTFHCCREHGDRTFGVVVADGLRIATQADLDAFKRAHPELCY